MRDRPVCAYSTVCSNRTAEKTDRSVDLKESKTILQVNPQPQVSFEFLCPKGILTQIIQKFKEWQDFALFLFT